MSNESDQRTLADERASAQAYRTELIGLLEPVLALLRNAHKDGLIISYHIGPDAGGTPSLQNLAITKLLA